MRRVRVDVPEETKQKAFETLEKALPRGFALQRRNTDKTEHLAFDVLGPQTDGHRDGVVTASINLAHMPMTKEIADGLKRSCQAWGRERLTVAGVDAEAV